MEEYQRECPKCKSDNAEIICDSETFDGTVYLVKCKNCGGAFL